MVDRDVRRPLLEVLDRIAALAHHLLDQRVGLADRAARVVDEAGLRDLPRLDVALPRARDERPDVELRAALLPLGQLGLGLPLGRRLGDGAFVLGPEALLERPRAPRPERA